MFDRNLIKFTKMKRKNYMILLILIILSTVIIWLIYSPTPHLRSIVSKTKLQIKNINSKLQVLEDDETESGKDLEVDSTYLELLGFVKDPKLFKENTNIDDETENNVNLNNQLLLNNINSRIPPLVTAFSHYTDKEKALIESKLRYFLNDLIIIYDLDLSSSEQLKIKKLCNSSCVLKTFKGDKYPRHLVDTKMKAYKPIIIQEVLNQFGSLIWIEPPNVFIANKIESFLNKSKLNGILTWPLSQPITQLTHPSMFKYFKTKPSDFYFAHILDTTQFIIYNNRDIHLNLMLPWVKCALKEDCIAPPGSKYYGCDFNRRPAFLYSSCHRYEMSAFSIITALLFNFDQTKYTLLFDAEDIGLSNRTINQLTSFDNLENLSSFIQTYYENSFMTEITETKSKKPDKTFKEQTIKIA